MKCASLITWLRVKLQFRLSGSSPDECCLAEAARSLGLALISRSEGRIELTRQKATETWNMLRVIPFTNERKMSSVLVAAENKTGELRWKLKVYNMITSGVVLSDIVRIYSKGADDAMMHRLQEAEPGLLKVAQAQLEAYSEGRIRGNLRWF